MRPFWEKSLTGRIVAILCCAMVSFWLLSEAISFYYRYTGTQSELRDELKWELKAIVDRENRRFDDAQRHARALLWFWMTLNQRLNALEPSRTLSARTTFVPFPDAHGDAVLVHRAREIIELFGDADPEGRRDAFLLLPTEGIVLYRPAEVSEADMQRKLAMLISLRDLRHSDSGTHWTAASHDTHGFVRVAATATDGASGVMAGQNLRIGDLSEFSKDLHLDHEPRFVLRSAQGELLWSDGEVADGLNQVLEQLPMCARTYSRRVKGQYVVCMPLGGPGWQLAVIFPTAAVTCKVLTLLRQTVPWTLGMQLWLIVVVFQILQWQLGRPLRLIVETIDARRDGDWGSRMPASRDDELGRIAHAYNTLLSTLNAYYKTLENKVEERTRELNEAKRIAESANHSKSEHIASISHEIRTPLNGIMGALALLARSQLQPRQQELVGVAQQSSAYLLGIVNNVLDYSRIEAGHLELAYEQTALLPLLDQAMLTIHLRANEKHLVLSTFVAPDVPQQIWMDALRVRQILINLLGNAVKFTEVGSIRLVVERRGDMLAMIVEDTGKGIPASYQLDIFKPFVQVRAHDSGNGLGLPIASRLANLMNGEILMSSMLGRGTRFTVLLPLQRGEVAPKPLSGRVTAPATLHAQLCSWGMEPVDGNNPLLAMPELCYLPGKLHRSIAQVLRGEAVQDDTPPTAMCPWALKVLIVDDVAVNRDIVGKMLRELGHQCQSAASGERALALGRNQVFDLVLMDVRMPDQDGMATTRCWRDADERILDPDTPIVALTANAMPTEHERARQAGMNGYLTKPVSLEQMADTLNRVAAAQLARGMELAPNAMVNMPMLDWSDRMMRDQLHKALKDLHHQAEGAWHAKDTEGMLNILHALKGCAGQGGLDLVHERIEQQERQIRSGRWVSRRDLSDLAELIAIQFV
ncbi:two component system sensor kinase [Burkholderia ubonensis]|uniref:two component system sensor kinase n=1 Tax=Burkholderia ubonensis TaxID=101571 RepID=UPI00075915CE|nr:two component system sensor kinase [Burkholderia ubonensis]KVK96218.1 hybrid sensor histidine kinase/response regulator [Burkholderia ubonensis]KVQ44349.1 hybrid sensor histidine kinase/response regulator [Burkholderia ubonensis]